MNYDDDDAADATATAANAADATDSPADDVLVDGVFCCCSNFVCVIGN